MISARRAAWQAVYIYEGVRPGAGSVRRAEAPAGDENDSELVKRILSTDDATKMPPPDSGKTLSEIATAQGVDLSAVQAAANASKVQAMKDKIAQAVKDGTITQEQADWLLQGLDKGYLFGGKGFGLGFGGRGHGRGGMMMPGMRGFGNGGNGTQQPAPSTSGRGTSS